MADENDEIEVILDNNAGAAGDSGSEGATRRADTSSDSIAELKRKLDEANSARIAAENRLNRATSEVDDVNLTLVTQAIDTVRRDASVLKANYSAAMAAGDYDGAAEIQMAMSTNAAKLLQLENGKSAMETKPRQQQVTDPVEALARQLTPRSAAWVRAHPQFATDPLLYRKMVAAHELAVADGIQADSDDYFAAVEGTLRIGSGATAEDPLSSASGATQRRSAPPAAPVSRSGAPPGKSPNVIRLSREEREIASSMGLTEQEYANNKAALIRDGRMTIN